MLCLVPSCVMAEMILLAVIVLLLGAPCIVASTLRAHGLFADGAVLQTTDDGGRPATLTGSAGAHERVTLSLAGRRFTATSDATGAWRITAPLASGGPYTATLRSDKGGSIVAHDVWVGDVFVCRCVLGRYFTLLCSTGACAPAPSTSVSLNSIVTQRSVSTQFRTPT